MLGIVQGSLKKRLIALIMFVSACSVLLTAAIIALVGYYSLQQNLFNDTRAAAHVIGERSQPYFAFNDVEGAYQSLKQSLSLNTHIQRSCLYDDEGRVFTRYVRHEQLPKACPEIESLAQEVQASSKQFSVLHPIKKRDGANEGWVYIESDFYGLEQYANQQLITVLAVLAGVLLMAYLLALSLQRTVSTPLKALADTAHKVSEEKDYSLRVAHPRRPDSSYEVDTLIGSFNEMIAEIGHREQELLQTFDELRSAKDISEQANRAKSHFLANISHELRTPLNAVIGFSSILQNQLFGPLGNEKYSEYVKDIHGSGVHLLEIINDILDLSKAEAGKLKLSMEELSLERVVRKAINVQQTAATAKEVVLSYELAEKLPTLVADRLRLTQILVNLLSNAIKFTEKGGQVKVSVHSATMREQEGEPVDIVMIDISDTGIGMHKEDIPRAFQSFGQVDSDLDRKFEGTGLGLPLCAKLMELHKGTIHIDSEIGIGTTVSLRFWQDATRFSTLVPEEI